MHRNIQQCHITYTMDHTQKCSKRLQEYYQYHSLCIGEREMPLTHQLLQQFRSCYAAYEPLVKQHMMKDGFNLTEKNNVTYVSK